ncbi:hypothetical protein OAN24_06160 [Pseudodesulfovibrio sp.]|nr:hypothetical protein [Pseudodesulfovibrio sp.]
METLPGIFAFILRRESILVAFVGSGIVSAIIDGVRIGTQDAWLFGALTVVVFGLLAWFTHQRYLLATWSTILVLLTTGAGYVYDSFNSLTHASESMLIVDLFKITAGIYLTWGALIIHRERHAGE